MPQPRPPESCANCGAAVPRTARSCPECGADERTGWREASLYDGLNLPDHAWEDSERAEPSGRNPKRINGLPWYWWCVGVGLTLLAVAGATAMFL